MRSLQNFAPRLLFFAVLLFAFAILHFRFVLIQYENYSLRRCTQAHDLSTPKPILRPALKHFSFSLYASLFP